MNRLPKHFLFPPDVQQVNVLNKYNNSFNNENVGKNNQNLPTKNNTNNNNLSEYEPTQPSTKNNSSYLKSNTKNKVSTTKVQSTVKSQKIVQINNNNLSKNQQVYPNNANNFSTQQKPMKLNTKQFLANTNGPQMLNRLRKRQTYNQSSDSQSHITENINTPSSTQKGQIKSKKKLIKTQLMPPKNKQVKNIRSSVQKRQKYKMEQKEKIKSKLNPWRTNTKKEEKIQSDLQSSPNTTLFNNNSNTNNTKNKFNNNLSNNTSNNKGFDRKSDHYSESQYIELSQKFSTVTDGKFYNNRPYGISNNNLNSNNSNSNNINNKVNNNNKQQQQQYNQDQIEQNIQMQTNSMYSNSNQKKQKQYDKQKYQFNYLKQKQIKQYTPQKQQVINQSICDSLDRRSPQKDFQYIGRQSYYGLAERLMENYMQERTRPFSPPFHQRQHTEEDQSPMFNRNQQNQQKQVELIYDPVLNCYYDHKTHTYYQLKN